MKAHSRQVKLYALLLNWLSFSFVTLLTDLFKARLLVTNGHDKEFIHLYEGHFTTEFLRMLDEPMTARAPTNGPTINRRKIPYSPFETFVDRIQPKA